MRVFVLQHHLPEHGAAFELHVLPGCTQVFLFLAQTDTNTVQCYVHFVQIHNVLSVFINKNLSCDPYLQKRKKPRLLPPNADTNQPDENVKP